MFHSKDNPTVGKLIQMATFLAVLSRTFRSGCFAHSLGRIERIAHSYQVLIILNRQRYQKV